MWSHYALRGTGICLQFDTQFDPFGKVRQVTYSERIPELDVTAMLLEQNYDEIIKLYCTKSSHWSYEREWRGIHKEANTSFKYVPHCLQAIYFGTEADRSFIELTQIVVRSTNRSVRLFSGTRSDVAYKVEFTELDHN